MSDSFTAVAGVKMIGSVTPVAGAQMTESVAVAGAQMTRSATTTESAR